MEWIQPEVIGEQPLPRMGHTAQLYNSKIVIHGGWNGFKVLDDVVFIELQPCLKRIKCWSPEPPRQARNAPARQFHTSSIIGHQMFVFGGGDGKYWLNDLMIFDLQKYRWIGPVKTKNNCPSPPSGRLQHAAVVHDKKLFIFGGEPDRYRQLNDLFCLDTTTMTWSQPAIKGSPPTP